METSDVHTKSATDKGMLQMCNFYGQWTAVCDYVWTSIVAYKKLDYSNPSKYLFNISQIIYYTYSLLT